MLVNGKSYETYIDNHKSWRFVGNSIVKKMLGNAGEMEMMSRDSQAFDNSPRPYDLNAVVLDYHKGKYNRSELIEFYILAGSTVDNFLALPEASDHVRLIAESTMEREILDRWDWENPNEEDIDPMDTPQH